MDAIPSQCWLMRPGISNSLNNVDPPSHIKNHRLGYRRWIAGQLPLLYILIDHARLISITGYQPELLQRFFIEASLDMGIGIPHFIRYLLPVVAVKVTQNQQSM